MRFLKSSTQLILLVALITTTPSNAADDAEWDRPGYLSIQASKVDVQPETNRYSVALGQLNVNVGYRIEVPLHNSRSTTMTPVGITSTCGCIAGFHDGTKVHAGGSTVLRVLMSPSPKEGDLSKRLQLLLKEAPNKPIDINVTGTFLAPLGFERSELRVNGQGSERQQITLTLRRRFPTIEMRTVSVRPLIGYLQDVAVSEATKEYIRYSATAVIPHDHIGATAVEQVAVHLVKDSATPLILPIHISLPDRIDIRPSTVYLVATNSTLVGRLIVIGSLKEHDLRHKHDLKGHMTLDGGELQPVELRVDTITERLLTATISIPVMSFADDSAVRAKHRMQLSNSTGAIIGSVLLGVADR